MKKIKSYVSIAALCSLAYSGYAQCTLSSNVGTSVCPGDWITLTANGLSSASWSASAPGSINTNNVANGNQISFSFKTPATSCIDFVTITAFDNNTSCSINFNIGKPPVLGSISGPAKVSPAQGWINEFPTVTYSLPSVTGFLPAHCIGSLNWSTPAGWTIVSGQGTNTIQVKPEVNSACSGNITVDATPGFPNFCGSSTSIPVSRTAISSGIITNLIQTADPWQVLEICPDDDILIDMSSSTFCGSSDNVFVSFYISDANWTNIKEYNRWLFPSEYNHIGGLTHLDIRAFLDTYYPLIKPLVNNYYKVKIAVGNGTAWNERTYHFHVNPPGGPAPLNPTAITLNPGGSQAKNVRCYWQGATTKTYEIIYQYRDAPGAFYSPGTVTGHLGCFIPDSMPAPFTAYVAKDILGLPDDYYFRFKVRECVCGTWTAWTHPMQMQKNGTTDVTTTKKEKEDLDIGLHPNPFTNQINLRLNLAEPSMVSINIADMTGRTTALLSPTSYPSGENPVIINTENVAAGFYVLIVNAGMKTYKYKLFCNS